MKKTATTFETKIAELNEQLSNRLSEVQLLEADQAGALDAGDYNRAEKIGAEIAVKQSILSRIERELENQADQARLFAHMTKVDDLNAACDSVQAELERVHGKVKAASIAFLKARNELLNITAKFEFPCTAAAVEHLSGLTWLNKVKSKIADPLENCQNLDLDLDFALEQAKRLASVYYDEQKRGLKK